MAHFHDDHDGYAELNLKEDKPGWQKMILLEILLLNMILLYCIYFIG